LLVCVLAVFIWIGFRWVSEGSAWLRLGLSCGGWHPVVDFLCGHAAELDVMECHGWHGHDFTAVGDVFGELIVDDVVTGDVPFVRAAVIAPP